MFYSGIKERSISATTSGFNVWLRSPAFDGVLESAKSGGIVFINLMS